MCHNSCFAEKMLVFVENIGHKYDFQLTTKTVNKKSTKKVALKVVVTENLHQVDITISTFYVHFINTFFSI